VYFSII